MRGVMPKSTDKSIEEWKKTTSVDVMFIRESREGEGYTRWRRHLELVGKALKQGPEIKL